MRANIVSKPIGPRCKSTRRRSPAAACSTICRWRNWFRYIDWSPFFLTWELKGKYPRIFDDPNVGGEARKLFDDARRLLDEIVAKKLLTARGVYGFWPAASIGDDIALFTDETRQHELTRFHSLRQQWERKGQTDFHSLADFIAPVESGRHDYLGAFAVTTGIGCDELARHFEHDHDDYNSIMTKALADRLAEAFAELLHKQARIDWGYGREEKLSSDDLIEEKYRGIRPAAGYPACPDHTEKRILFDLLDAEKQTGITLTENFAMYPAASVSGLYFAHPGQPLLRRRPHHARSGRRLRPPQRHAASGSGTLAVAESGVRSGVISARAGESGILESITAGLLIVDRRAISWILSFSIPNNRSGCWRNAMPGGSIVSTKCGRGYTSWRRLRMMNINK